MYSLERDGGRVRFTLAALLPQLRCCSSPVLLPLPRGLTPYPSRSVRCPRGLHSPASNNNWLCAARNNTRLQFSRHLPAQLLQGPCAGEYHSCCTSGTEAKGPLHSWESSRGFWIRPRYHLSPACTSLLTSSSIVTQAGLSKVAYKRKAPKPYCHFKNKKPALDSNLQHPHLLRYWTPPYPVHALQP